MSYELGALSSKHELRAIMVLPFRISRLKFETSGSGLIARSSWLVAHSYRRLSTGSSWAALLAGSVPKIIPTSDETPIAMIAERPEIGMR